MQQKSSGIFSSKHQQQPEEKLIETPAKEPIPVEHLDHPPAQELPETESEPPSELLIDWPNETLSESPSEPLSDLPNETLSDPPSETPKRNFFSNLFSKLGKRKK